MHCKVKSISWESSQTVYVHVNDVIASCELPVATLPNLALAAFKFYTHCYRHFGAEFVGKKMYRPVMRSVHSVPTFLLSSLLVLEILHGWPK